MPSTTSFATRLLPHGPYSLIPTVLTTMGWIAALFQDNCSYAITTNPVLLDALSFGSNAVTVELGMMAFRITDGEIEDQPFDWYGHCVPYPKNSVLEFDWLWGFTKWISFASLVLGGGATFYLWTSTCCPFQRKSWRFAGWEVAVACALQTLSFVWFANGFCRGSQCMLHFGSKADIVATVLWMVAAVMILGYYPPPRTAEQGTEGDGVMISEQQGELSPNNTRGEDGDPKPEEIEMATSLDMSDTRSREADNSTLEDIQIT